MEDWLIQPTINIMDLRLSPKQEVISSHCSIVQRDHRPMPQAYTAQGCWVHFLHNCKSCSLLYPWGLTRCLEHLTSTRKCFLNEWVMSEQITSSMRTLICDSQSWAKSWNLLFWRHGSETCYLVSEDTGVGGKSNVLSPASPKPEINWKRVWFINWHWRSSDNCPMAKRPFLNHISIHYFGWLYH